MSWPIKETDARAELPTHEAARRSLETRAGHELSDTLRIDFARENRGPIGRNHLRVSARLLDNYQAAREVIIERSRHEDFDVVRSIGHQPLDMGIVGPAEVFGIVG